jgi:hypothetical protein
VLKLPVLKLPVLKLPVLKSIYRREPVVSFAITIGIVNALLGGMTDHPALLGLGVGTTGVTLLLRWWMRRQPPIVPLAPRRVASYALPPARPSRPPLHLPKKAPPLR